MLVREGDRIYLEAPAKAEPADSVVTSDYYTQLPQIRLTGDSPSHPMRPETTAEAMLDGNDVTKLVECAIPSCLEHAIRCASSYLDPPGCVRANFPVRS